MCPCLAWWKTWHGSPPRSIPTNAITSSGKAAPNGSKEKFHVELLAEIPLVAAVGKHGDDGAPIALGDSITAQSFIHLAHNVIDAVDRRNSDLPPTVKVELK